MPRLADLADLQGRVTTARVARLATVTPEGAPHVVTVTFAVDEDRIHTAIDEVKPKSTPLLARLRNVAAEPRVSLLVDSYSEDWARLWWVRVDGVAAVHHGATERQRTQALLAAKYPQYEAALAPSAVLVVTALRWSGWSAT